MYRIGICDDEQEYIAAVETKVLAYFGTRSDYRLTIYEQAELVLQDANQLYLLFLDIEMLDMDGLELKKRLMELNPACEIVFVTNYKRYMGEVFGKNVVAYVAKDKLSRIGEILQDFEQRKKEERQVQIADEWIRVADIYYLQASKSYIEIYTKQRKYVFAIYLKEALNRINSPMFYQIHRSYAVNCKYIQRVTSEKVTLLDGQVLPISRSHRDGFKQAYFQYLRGR